MRGKSQITVRRHVLRFNCTQVHVPDGHKFFYKNKVWVNRSSLFTSGHVTHDCTHICSKFLRVLLDVKFSVSLRPPSLIKI